MSVPCSTISCVEILTPKMMVLLKVEPLGGVYVMRIGPLWVRLVPCKEGSRGTPSRFSSCEDTTRRHWLGTRKQALVRAWPCWQLDLGLPTSTEINFCFLQSMVFCYNSSSGQKLVFNNKRELLIQTHAPTWMNLRRILLNEKNQSPRVIHYMIPFTQQPWNVTMTKMNRLVAARS